MDNKRQNHLRYVSVILKPNYLTILEEMPLIQGYQFSVLYHIAR